jgi:hypothetical protein
MSIIGSYKKMIILCSTTILMMNSEPFLRALNAGSEKWGDKRIL